MSNEIDYRTERSSTFDIPDRQLLESYLDFFKPTPIITDLIDLAFAGSGSGAIGLGDNRQLNIYPDNTFAFTSYFPKESNESVRLRINTSGSSINIGTLLHPDRYYDPGTIERHMEGITLPDTIPLAKSVKMDLNFYRQSLFNRIIQEKPIMTDEIWKSITDQIGNSEPFRFAINQGETKEGIVYAHTELNYNPRNSDGSPATIDNRPGEQRAIQMTTMVFQDNELIIKHSPSPVPSSYFHFGSFGFGTKEDDGIPFEIK